MNDKDWACLQAIYEEKNITRAAQKLHTSQPALTYRLNQLEEQFDVSIFLKGRKEIKFTPEGEALVRYAKRMTNELQSLRDQIQEFKENTQGTLRIGVSNNIVHYDLPPILKAFYDLYPRVNFTIHSDSSAKIIEELENQAFHIGLVRGDHTWEESKILLCSSQICVVSKAPIEFKMLPELPLIKHKTDPATQKELQHWWDEHFLKPMNRFMEIDRPETCKEIVKQGLGYCIVPRYMAEAEERSGELFVIPLVHQNGQPYIRNLWAVFREEETKLTIFNAFIDYLKDYYKVLIE